MNKTKICGIICEYNPFHNGHMHQIAEARRLSGADYVIAVMSGDFVQRGEPAVIDKWARTEMALRCGADIVLELPTVFALSSAEYFATGAVDVLQKNGKDSILVLTHTNAGITSIREKFKKESVQTKNVTICTIAGFLQKIVHSLTNAPILQREGQYDFYSQLYVTALDLFKKNNQILRNTIENSYKYIFVDEFQDCNRSQYEIVRIMSKWNVRVHMLLDSLQTIFNFDTDHPDYLAFENRCRKLTPDKVFILDIP